MAMNMASPPTTDSADEAGGEDVYCSDGLPPLKAPKAPFVALNNRQEGDDILDSEDLVDPSVERFLFSNESPLEKLTRLQHEVSSLDFSSSHADSQELNRMVADLQTKLEAMTMLSPQEDLARMVEQHLSEHVNASKGSSDLQRAGVVYELYGGVVATPTLLEERLMKVEQLIGGGSDGSKSVLQRLQEMEEKVQKVNPKSLEDASMKAKVIRADLEAAAKAKSKLSSGSSTADSRMIADLHQELNQLEGLSSHLPALTQRLEQLAHIHVQSSTTVARLSGAEQDVHGIQVTLQSMEKALSALETNMVENTKKMEANLKVMAAQVSQM